MVACALTVTVADTVAPAAGAVIETVGGVVSGGVLLTVTGIASVLAALPAASLATACKVCAPFGSAVASQANEYGDAVSLA